MKVIPAGRLAETTEKDTVPVMLVATKLGEGEVAIALPTVPLMVRLSGVRYGTAATEVDPATTEAFNEKRCKSALLQVSKIL